MTRLLPRGPTATTLAAVVAALWPASCSREQGISRAEPPDAAVAAGAASDARFTFSPPDGPMAVIGPGGCLSLPDEDKDHDGFTVRQGDCNDCDKQVNPGAYDVPGNQIDEDCSGKADDETVTCDGDSENGDALAAARTLGICRTARPGAQGKDRTWGLLRAAYVFPDGTTRSIVLETSHCGRGGVPPSDLSHGILQAFGNVVKPREGLALLALSTGVARAGEVLLPNVLFPSPHGAEMCTSSLTPMGFPVSDYSTCGDLEKLPGNDNANDSIALELTIRAPTNAAGLSFDFDFYTYEYYQYVCSSFNDAFVALLYSRAPGIPANHDIAVDSQGNPVSVNNGYIEVCQPHVYNGTKGMMPFSRSFLCKLGTQELAGTGFESRGATGWLETRSDIVPGEELTLRLAIWDAGDEILDSTVLIDNFHWELAPGGTVTVRPPIP